MKSGPKVKLSRLRQIGWDCWDPIGIHDFGDDWTEGAADEYDRYLLQVVSILADGGSEEAATAYLVQIAESHMGLGSRPEHAPAAARTVEAVAAYLHELAKA